MISAYRVVFILWMVGVLVVWAIVSYCKSQIMDVPQSVVEIVALAIGGKIAQGALVEK
jgi:hypothetical protein